MGPARWRLVAVCALSAAVAPVALRHGAALLVDLMGLTTIASHLALARSWERVSRDVVDPPAAVAVSPARRAGGTR